MGREELSLGLKETKEEMEKRFEDMQQKWETFSPQGMRGVQQAVSIKTLYDSIQGILPPNLKNLTEGMPGNTREEKIAKLTVWANTPPNHREHDLGFQVNSNGGDFLSDTLRMQIEFQETLREQLSKLTLDEQIAGNISPEAEQASA